MARTPTRSHPRSRARPLGLTVACIIATVALLTVPTAAQAHHGWDGFETNNLIYISGTVSTEGEWGDPHSHFDIDIDEEIPATTPEDLVIPEGLSGPEDSVRIQAAPAYEGPHDEVEIIIAPPWWSANNGLDRSLEVGERFQGVGYINRADDRLFRPVAFWYGEAMSPVNQVIGNSLPVRAPISGEANAGEESAEVPSTVEDPLELDRPSANADTADHSDSGRWVVWIAFVAVTVVTIASGVLYMRRLTARAKRGSDA